MMKVRDGSKLQNGACKMGGERWTEVTYHSLKSMAERWRCASTCQSPCEECMVFNAVDEKWSHLCAAPLLSGWTDHIAAPTMIAMACRRDAEHEHAPRAALRVFGWRKETILLLQRVISFFYCHALSLNSRVSHYPVSRRLGSRKTLFLRIWKQACRYLMHVKFTVRRWSLSVRFPFHTNHY